MKKEKHTAYRFLMAGLILLLILGVVLLVIGVQWGPDRVYLPRPAVI